MMGFYGHILGYHMSGMRQLRILSGEISQLFDEMSLEFSTYQNKSQLSCLAGCGKCCTNPEIETTPLEMLPMALDLFDRGLAESTLQQINNGSSICISYVTSAADGKSGYCRSYLQRPGICRMFGAAGYINKSGDVALSVCRLIKEASPEQYEHAKLQANLAPKMSTWSAKIKTLEPRYSERLYPINISLKIMLEKVLTTSFYEQDFNLAHTPV